MNLPDDWALILPEWESGEYDTLKDFVAHSYQTTVCYPPVGKVFKSLYDTSPDEVKVMILGQDPYHGPGQAHGLSFSVPSGVTHPPSLRNIFKEIEQELQVPYPISGDLSRWSEQGVLLLNATLTVEQGNPGSHQKKGWEDFTDLLIKRLSERNESIVFMLWGGFAKAKVKLIDANKHLILTSGHPSPLSANRGLWFGHNHFIKSNDYLTKQGREPIKWEE